MMFISPKSHDVDGTSDHMTLGTDLFSVDQGAYFSIAVLQCEC